MAAWYIEGFVSKADPKLSAGARLERQAVMRYLRRLINGKGFAEPCHVQCWNDLAYWMRMRQLRYNAKPGGLGKR